MNVEPSALEKAFYQMSRKLHPDVYATASGREQEWSLQQSSLLNDAYRTLKDPIARTEYLLKLEGVEFEGQSKAATEQARETGNAKETGSSSGDAGGSLRVEHATGRSAHE